MMKAFNASKFFKHLSRRLEDQGIHLMSITQEELFALLQTKITLGWKLNGREIMRSHCYVSKKEMEASNNISHLVHCKLNDTVDLIIAENGKNKAAFLAEKEARRSGGKHGRGNFLEI